MGWRPSRFSAFSGATFIALLLAGCQEPMRDRGEEEDMPIAPAGPTTHLNLVKGSNFTVLLPYQADADIRIQDAELSMTGPRWKSFAFLHFLEDPLAAPPRYHGNFGEMQERAQQLIENSWLGQREVTCLDHGRAPPCPLSAADQPNATSSAVLVGDIVPAGRGYLLIDARFTGTFRLNVTFDKAFVLGPELLQEVPPMVVTWDQFSSAYADVRHCGTIYACGVMLDGTFPLAFPDYDYVYASLQGRFAPGQSALTMCVASVDGTGLKDCNAGQTPLPPFIYVNLNRVLPGGNAAQWEVSAYGSGPDGSSLGGFMFHGQLTGFNLPEEHPLA